MRALVEMNSGLLLLLKENKYEDLGRMYSLFKRVDTGLDLFRQELGNYLKETGKQLVAVCINLSIFLIPEFRFVCRDKLRGLVFFCGGSVNLRCKWLIQAFGLGFLPSFPEQACVDRVSIKDNSQNRRPSALCQSFVCWNWGFAP